MRLIALVLLLFATGQTIAFAVPGAYERVFLYYLYSIDCQLHDGKPTRIATGCKGTGRAPCTLDQLLRYVAATPKDLPTRQAPATHYPVLPDLDTTARALLVKDAKGNNFAGAINPGRALPGGSRDFSIHLSQLGSVALKFSNQSPEHTAILKKSVEAVRNLRRQNTLNTFREMPGNTLVVKSEAIPVYTGAPSDVQAEVLDLQKTLEANPDVSKNDIVRQWKKNAEGGHQNNLKELKETLELMDQNCS